MSQSPHCLLCGQRHDERYLCDDGRKVIADHLARTASLESSQFKMEPLVPATDLGIGGEDDRLLKAFTIHACVYKLDSGSVPAIAMGGSDHRERRLPTWVLSGTPRYLRLGSANFHAMVEESIALAES